MKTADLFIKLLPLLQEKGDITEQSIGNFYTSITADNENYTVLKEFISHENFIATLFTNSQNYEIFLNLIIV